jgi:hypothetical protein
MTEKESKQNLLMHRVEACPERSRKMVNDFGRSKMNMQPSTATSQTSTAMPEDRVRPTFLRGGASEAMAPGNGVGEEGEARGPHSSHAGPVFADTLHELANAVTAVLLNAQVLEWKLPPYSRLKRPVREIGRHAQRGGALLKCLLEAKGDAGPEVCPQVPSSHGPCPETWLR